MRTSKSSEEQIIGFLRQAEAGMPIKEIGRKHGFPPAPPSYLTEACSTHKVNAPTTELSRAR